MQHSVVARYASWPATRYASPSARDRARRLGLRAAPGFVPAPSARTVLRRSHAAPVTQLRDPWRSLHIAPSGGLPRPAARMLWTRSARSGRPRRSPAAPAWRA